MDVHRFVSGSAVILAGWLAVTFFRDVPSQRYPRLDKYPSVSSTDTDEKPPVPALDGQVMPVSVSR
ncbi:MAG: hypothetical protein H7A49_00605 [Akkermansiaceae bacterium]|nr:hypothetical protein [Akkermansiaceae bacterium]MCP5542382.1 hypothetical protein [Akkermansiaceae bacterium]MCP5546083.1 hypothetical protein [Akkermansiaceae bacterium]